jgi:hypothetical protein
MNCHRISRVSGKAARTATVAAALFALAAPFSVAPAASASHAPPVYTVSLSCTTSTQIEVIGGLLQSGWKWYQGGTSGKLLASGSLDDQCPLASGSNSATFSGTQPAKADTLFAFVEIGLGGCGNLTDQTISFTPGSPVSLKMTVSATSPCSYQPNLPKATVDAAFTLQS